ncbi:unnamed protein product [Calicophoron daubneyi]|uniref:Uncharacterized protein n=1 Tax=Calicophoron daubneyi TaxID=300641 RepID=A0AAV2T8C0_CALDB
MIRADVWEKSHASSSDADFEEMLFRLYSPFEVNFEMLHMVHYVKRVVDPETFDAFGCSVLSAEFWLHELFPIPVDPEVFSVLPSSTSSQDMDISHGDVEEHSVEDRLETVASDDTQLPLPKKEHRPVPGFKTILQCGANTICDSSRIESSTAPSALEFTPLSGNINKMLKDTVLSTSQYQPKDPRSAAQVDTSAKKPVSENYPDDTPFDPPVLYADPRRSRSTKTLVNSPKLAEINRDASAWPKWDPLVESTGVIPKMTIKPQASATVVRQAPYEPPKEDENPKFEIFYDPLGLEAKAQQASEQKTVAIEQPAQSDVLSETTRSCSTHGTTELSQPKKPTPFEIFYDPFGLDTRTQKIPTKQTSVEPPVNVQAVVSEATEFNDTALFDIVDQKMAAAREGRLSIWGRESMRPSCTFNSPPTLFKELLERATQSPLTKR